MDANNYDNLVRRVSRARTDAEKRGEAEEARKKQHEERRRKAVSAAKASLDQCVDEFIRIGKAIRSQGFELYVDAEATADARDPNKLDMEAEVKQGDRHLFTFTITATITEPEHERFNIRYKLETDFGRTTSNLPSKQYSQAPVGNLATLVGDAIEHALR